MLNCETSTEAPMCPNANSTTEEEASNCLADIIDVSTKDLGRNRGQGACAYHAVRGTMRGDAEGGAESTYSGAPDRGITCQTSSSTFYTRCWRSPSSVA